MILSSVPEFSRIRNCSVEFIGKSCIVATDYRRNHLSRIAVLCYFDFFNTVPYILSLVQSRVLPVSVCFFPDSDSRTENSELSSEPQMRVPILTRIEGPTVPR